MGENGLCPSRTIGARMRDPCAAFDPLMDEMVENDKKSSVCSMEF
jgi:hypothetical protein